MKTDTVISQPFAPHPFNAGTERVGFTLPGWVSHS